MKVEIQIKQVYGNETIYPVNEAARLIAQIAGTKTLTRTTLKFAQRLGYSIVVAPARFGLEAA